MKIINKLKRLLYLFQTLDTRLSNIQNTLGRIESRYNATLKLSNISNAEFKIFSQWGEDGIIQYLINKVEINKKTFIEFGVENYIESNTRFLLTNDNWSGLVIDGSERNIKYIKSDEIYWRYNLKAECAFIDKDNINQLIEKNGMSGDVGLLSVDIDGNDYWIWQAINIINPNIVICEYNSLWGATRSVTTPYQSNFIRGKAHYSNLYYGASIQALVDLAKTKGYSLVAGNKAGNNIFFVRNDLLGEIKAITAKEAWVMSLFRESRNSQNELTFLDYNARLKLVESMPLFDLETEQVINVSDLSQNNILK